VTTGRPLSAPYGDFSEERICLQSRECCRPWETGPGAPDRQQWVDLPHSVLQRTRKAFLKTDIERGPPLGAKLLRLIAAWSQGLTLGDKPLW
jgi:hypothetical protein